MTLNEQKTRTYLIHSATLLFLCFSLSLPLFADESEGAEKTEQSQEKETRIEELVQKLSAEKRPTRQNAASKLIVDGSREASRKVSKLLYSGSDVQKDALLTAIANKVGDNQSVSHLLEPILRVYAGTSNGKENELFEAISYFPDRLLRSTVRIFLNQNSGVDGHGYSVSLLKKARLIRLFGKKQIQVDPVRTAEMLFALSPSLPDELHPEILVVLQKMFQFYSLTTFEEWKQWWEETQEMSEVEIYRSLIRRRSDAEMDDWKTAVNRVFSMTSNESSSSDFSKLLDTDDPRKLVFLLRKIRERKVKLPAKPGKSTFIALLTNQNQPRVHKQVIQTIGALNVEDARKEVEGFVDHYRPSLRKAAAITLGKIGNSSSGEQLLSQFQEEKNTSVLIAILDAFTALNYTDAIFKLHDRLIKDSDMSSSVRNEIVSTLGTMGQKKSLPILKSVLEKSEPKKDVTLRFNIALSIGQIGSVDGISSLIKLTEAPTPSVRGAAAQALGNITFEDGVEGGVRHRQAIDALFELLREAEDPTVKRRAAKSLANISLPNTAIRLAELVIKREDGVEDVIRNAITNTLDHHPNKVTEVVPILQQAGYHSLVTDIAGKMKEGKIKTIEKEERDLLLMNFVQSYLEQEDWSSVISTIEGLDKKENRSWNVMLLKARGYLGLGNFSEAKSILNELEEQSEEQSSLWWEVQYQKARMYYLKGPPEKALSFIQNKLRPLTPPESVDQKLKRIEERHAQELETIDRLISELLNSGKQGEEEGKADSKRVERLLERRRYHHVIVRRVLNRLPSNPVLVEEVLTPKVTNLLSKITGRTHSLSGSAGVEEIRGMIKDWSDWLEQQKQKQSPEETSGSSSEM